MDRLVLLVIGVGEEYRRQAVEGELAVRFGVADRAALRGWLKGRAVRLAVGKRTHEREPERVGPHVQAAEPDPQERTESRPQRLGVAHLPEIPPDVGRAPSLL